MEFLIKKVNDYPQKCRALQLIVVVLLGKVQKVQFETP